MFTVDDDGKVDNMTSEEFYIKYGTQLDPIYFQGAYSSHIITIGRKKIKITER